MKHNRKHESLPPRSGKASLRQWLTIETGKLNQEITRLGKLENMVSWGRLISFILGVILIFTLFSFNFAAGASGIILVAVVFLFLITRHLKLTRERHFLAKRRDVIQVDIDCLDGHFPKTSDGIQYLDESHPYTDDLDIFGNRSLFQYMNRTRTRKGADKLAQALQEPATPEMIRLRQDAAKELGPQWNYRVDFLAKSDPEQDDTADFRTIESWVQSPNQFLHKSWIQWGRYIVPPVTIILLGIVIAFYPLSLIIFVLLIPGFILNQHTNAVTQIHKQTERAVLLLRNYADLIRHIEAHAFNSTLLQEVRARFAGDGGIPASVAIKKLSYLIRQLNVRLNPFSFILNLFGFWDFHWVIGLEKWKEENRAQLPEWIEALGEMDFLITLANASFLHPEWNWPLVEVAGPIEMKQVGHPLIFQKSVVRNDLEMPEQRQIRLITGSNMSGKSTFLRTVGINLVMAYAGFPVFADACRLPVKHVFTSMRTKDNLQESTSSFYAELKRLRAALIAVQHQDNAFFLLDEILKGTNSIDRHTGSKALILQLLDADGIGLIATHDLDLAALEQETGGKMENWSFDVEIRDGKLLFDYTIRRGACSSFNATHLMQQMGFDLNYLKKYKA